jgi:BTB/POZ domain
MDALTAEHGPVADLCLRQPGSDFKLQVADGTVQLPVHSAVLAAISPYFEAALNISGAFTEAQTRVLKKDDWTESAARSFLQLCYTKKASVSVSELPALLSYAAETVCDDPKDSITLSAADAFSADDFETFRELVDVAEASVVHGSLAAITEAVHSWEQRGTTSDLRTFFSSSSSTSTFGNKTAGYNDLGHYVLRTKLWLVMVSAALKSL